MSREEAYGLFNAMPTLPEHPGGDFRANPKRMEMSPAASAAELTDCFSTELHQENLRDLGYWNPIQALAQRLSVREPGLEDAATGPRLLRSVQTHLRNEAARNAKLSWIGVGHQHTLPSAAAVSHSALQDGSHPIQTAALRQRSPSRLQTRIRPNKLRGCSQRPAQRSSPAPHASAQEIGRLNCACTPQASTCKGPARLTEGRAPVAITKAVQPAAHGATLPPCPAQASHQGIPPARPGPTQRAAQRQAERWLGPIDHA